MPGSWPVDRIRYARRLDDLARLREAAVHDGQLVAGPVLGDLVQRVATGARAADGRAAAGRHTHHGDDAGGALDRGHHPDVLMAVQDQLGAKAFHGTAEALAVGELA